MLLVCDRVLIASFPGSHSSGWLGPASPLNQVAAGPLFGWNTDHQHPVILISQSFSTGKAGEVQHCRFEIMGRWCWATYCRVRMAVASHGRTGWLGLALCISRRKCRAASW